MYNFLAFTKPAIDEHRKGLHEIRVIENNVDIPSLQPISDEIVDLLQACTGISLFLPENGTTQCIYYNHIKPHLQQFYDENIRITNSDISDIFQTSAGQKNRNWKAYRQASEIILYSSVNFTVIGQ